MPRNVFSITIDRFIPKSIAFGLMCGDTRALLAFGLDDGRMYAFHFPNDTSNDIYRHTLRQRDGKIEHTRNIGGKMYVFLCDFEYV
jgi:hypothetical protein